LVSKKRALTAAWKLQLCMGSGKSWRTQGMLYLAAAWIRRGLARRSLGTRDHKLDDGDACAGRRLEGEASWTGVAGVRRTGRGLRARREGAWRHEGGGDEGQGYGEAG